MRLSRRPQFLSGRSSSHISLGSPAECVALMLSCYLMLLCPESLKAYSVDFRIIELSEPNATRLAHRARNPGFDEREVDTQLRERFLCHGNLGGAFILPFTFTCFLKTYDL